jgi:ribA/ribD-fused uncharacterized protein
MRTTDTHVYFWGGFLSNFWYTKIEPIPDCAVQGYVFKSSEQLYMVEKAVFFEDYAAAYMITQAYDAKEAKRIGRLVKNFDAKKWDAVSYDKMLIACRAKYSQNDWLKNMLLKTGDRILVEASPIDTIWGVGLHEDNDSILDEKNWLGENRLGRVLMQVRDELNAGML